LRSAGIQPVTRFLRSCCCCCCCRQIANIEFANASQMRALSMKHWDLVRRGGGVKKLPEGGKGVCGGGGVKRWWWWWWWCVCVCVWGGGGGKNNHVCLQSD
jgi:hypothetical protein